MVEQGSTLHLFLLTSCMHPRPGLGEQGKGAMTPLQPPARPCEKWEKEKLD